MNFIALGREGVNLQATLAAASAGANASETVLPHHPITCSSALRLEADGQFACAHATAPAGDERTQFCIDDSVAMLLIELSHDL
jgi:hypothetical protein